MVLQAGRWAPSASNKQPWEFLVVTDAEVITRLSKLGTYARFVRKAPLVIATVTRPDIAPQWHLIDGTIATHQMMLQAWAMGIGSCWIGSLDREAAKKLLDVPEDYHLLTIVPYGHVKRVPKPTLRKDLVDLVHHERHGQRE